MPLLEVDIAGFRSIQRLTIAINRTVTVAVGPNNSGKSTVLRALEFFSEGVRRGTLFSHGSGNKEAVLKSVLTRGTPPNLAFTARGKYRDQTITYTVGFRNGSDFEEVSVSGETYSGVAKLEESGVSRLPNNVNYSHSGAGQTLSYWARLPNAPDSVRSLYADLCEIDIYDFSLGSIRMPAPLITPNEEPRLAPNGSNLAAILDWLSNERPEIRDAIDKSVRTAVPEIERVVTPNSAQGGKVLGIIERKKRFGPNEISDGVAYFIAIATAAHFGGTRATLLGLEEPERGVHPRRLQQLVTILKRFADQGTQIFLTTHSPVLLDEFRDTPESVLVFDRQEGTTRVNRLSETPGIKDALDSDLALGDIWYSGLAGGVPK